LIVDSPEPELTPEAVAARVFSFTRRGYDAAEVQAFLRRVSDEVRRLRVQVRDLEKQVVAADDRVARYANLDEDRVAEVLGEETARILETAREAAAGIRARAADDAEATLAGARSEAEVLVAEASEAAEAMRAEAAGVLEVRQGEAEVIVGEQLAAAQATVDEARAQSERLVAQAEADAEATREAGRQRGREMVAEAQEVRERLLRDLSRRRKALRNQIEQLQAGREELVSAYEVVRESYLVATGQLEGMSATAQEAARRVGERLGAPEAVEVVDPDLLDLVTEVDADEVVAGVVAPPVGEGDGPFVDEPGVGTPAVEVPPVDLADDAPADTTGDASADTGGVDPGEAPGGQAGDGDGDGDGDGLDGADGGASTPASDLFARLRLEAAPEGEDDEPVDGTGGGTAGASSVESSPDAPDDDGETIAGDDSDSVGDDDTGDVTGDDGDGDDDEASEESGGGVHLLVVRRGATVLEMAPTLARRMKRCMAEEQNEILDRLRRSRSRPTLEELLTDADDHRRIYAHAALPTLGAVVATAGEALAESDPGVVGSPDPDLPGVVADHLADRVVRSLRAATERHLVAAGGTADAADAAEAMADGLRQAYRAARTESLDDLTEEAVMEAFNRGVLDAMVEGTPVVWVGAGTCAACPQRPDGPLVRDTSLVRSAKVPPLAAGCRCVLVPAR